MDPDRGSGPGGGSQLRVSGSASPAGRDLAGGPHRKAIEEASRATPGYSADAGAVLQQRPGQDMDPTGASMRRLLGQPDPHGRRHGGLLLRPLVGLGQHGSHVQRRRFSNHPPPDPLRGTQLAARIRTQRLGRRLGPGPHPPAAGGPQPGRGLEGRPLRVFFRPGAGRGPPDAGAGTAAKGQRLHGSAPRSEPSRREGADRDHCHEAGAGTFDPGRRTFTAPTASRTVNGTWPRDGPKRSGAKRSGSRPTT